VDQDFRNATAQGTRTREELQKDGIQLRRLADDFLREDAECLQVEETFRQKQMALRQKIAAYDAAKAVKEQMFQELNQAIASSQQSWQAFDQARAAAQARQADRVPSRPAPVIPQPADRVPSRPAPGSPLQALYLRAARVNQLLRAQGRVI
jgi:hypothetical protein